VGLDRRSSTSCDTGGHHRPRREAGGDCRDGGANSSSRTRLGSATYVRALDVLGKTDLVDLLILMANERSLEL
jgi:hypothetical protein